MELKVIDVRAPPDTQFILGQSHFIKTVEDLYEALVTAGQHVRFGIAFCESSGPALVRHEGNDPELEEAATRIALDIAAGHCFVILLRQAYPINVLNRIKDVMEVVTLYCATANPVQVVIAETEQGRGILGVIDGVKARGVESEEHRRERHEFLRKIGYKR
jgi:adenosine/AMP kinase